MPFGERRAAARGDARRRPTRRSTSRRSPATPTRRGEWFDTFEGAGLDGVVAKDVTGEYKEGERGWLKVKHLRTADCVVAGFRTHKDGKGVGSLLLGLYNDDGKLQHVGVASSFNAARRAELVDELARVPHRLVEGSPVGRVGRRRRPRGRRPHARARRAAGTRRRT